MALKLYGASTVWDDLMIPGFAVKTTGTSPPDFTTVFAGSGNIDYYAFDGGSLLEQVYFSVQMPHCWKEGSTIYPHVHFAPTSTNTGDTNERVVRFGLEYTWGQIGEAFAAPQAFNMDSAGFVPNTSLWKHLLCTNGTGIAGTGKGLSSILMGRLYRNPADSVDTYPQDVAFLSFDLHYEIDALGSEQEYVK
jgi:hypothetical protein